MYTFMDCPHVADFKFVLIACVRECVRLLVPIFMYAIAVLGQLSNQ